MEKLFTFKNAWSQLFVKRYVRAYSVLFAFFACSFCTPVRAQYNVLLSFNAVNGANPNGSLILSGNRLYGMTADGGANADGNVFSIKTDGTGYSDLFDFDGVNGLYPYGTLLLAGNTLYGMTSNGGVSGYGNVFSITTGGARFSDLLDFNSINGNFPVGALIISHNTLFGMTAEGGQYGEGNVFSMDTNGNRFSDLMDFNGVNGGFSYGSLVLSGNMLFGMTSEGGANFAGNIFTLDTTGNQFSDLFDFNGLTGETPYGDLALSGNTLFGMTSAGGVNFEGNVFAVLTNGSGFSDLLDFDGANGASPDGNVTLSHDTLYGMTSSGGKNSDGNIFYVLTNGNGYKDMFDFNSTDGSYPFGNITHNANMLYGMASSGDTDDVGVVFSLVLCSLTSTASESFSGCNGDNNATAVVLPANGKTPFTYFWSTGGTKATQTGLNAGTYTVSISDNNSCASMAVVTITQPAALLIPDVHLNVGAKCTSSARVVVEGGVLPYTYAWRGVTGTTDSVAHLCSGTYCCVVIDNNKCKDSICVNITGTAVDNVTGNTPSINIYPNPGDGRFTIQLSVNSGQSGMLSGAETSVEVYNMLGEKVYSNYQIIKSSNYQIDLSNLPNGVYFYRMLDASGGLIGEGKLIIQK